MLRREGVLTDDEFVAAESLCEGVVAGEGEHRQQPGGRALGGDLPSDKCV